MRATTSLAYRLLRNYTIDDNGCWLWNLSTTKIGYGLIRDQLKMRSTHRVSYEIHHGMIPENLCVCHSCDNPRCINPQHLWLGTRLENAQDAVRKNRYRGSLGRSWTMPKGECIHCKRMVSVNALDRWHNDHCRMKNINTNEGSIN